MNPYRDKPIEQPQGKPRSWLKTFGWKLKLLTSGSFRSRFERCEHCNFPLATKGRGDTLWHAFMWLNHNVYDCKNEQNRIYNRRLLDISKEICDKELNG